MNKKILIIDDDHETSEMVEKVLRSDEFIVYHAFSGMEGLRQTYQVHPDLIILDVMMPDMDGFTVCAHLREVVNTPILMLTALSNEKDMLRGYKVGADDFLRKPFNNNELRVRVQALLRRAELKNKGDTFNIAAYTDPVIEFDFAERVVKVMGRMIQLSPKEYELLACLVRERGKVISHYGLVTEVWGDAYVDAKAIVSLYIFYLRKKLQDGKHGHQYIRTFWGRGYWFAPWREDHNKE